MDGLHEAWIEFKANRKKQFLGFEMFLWCIEPQFDLNYASFYSSSGQNQCNNPSPPGTSGRKKRSAISTFREMVRHITNYKITTGVVNLLRYLLKKVCLFKLLTDVTMSFYDLTSLTCSAGTIASCSPILKLSLLRKENPGGRQYSHLHIYKHWFLVHKYTHIVHAHAHICTQCHTPVACINTHHKTYVHAHVYTRTHMLITLTGYCFQHQWT